MRTYNEVKAYLLDEDETDFIIDDIQQMLECCCPCDCKNCDWSKLCVRNSDELI